MGVVVAGVDCSPRSGPVLMWAERQAGLMGSEVLALTAWGAGLPDAAQGRDLDVGSSAVRALQDAVDEALPPPRSATVTRLAVPEDPVDALVERSAGADVVVVGHHHGHLPMGLGSVTAKVVAHAHCPVAVIGRPPTTHHDRIVVGVDGSGSARAALRWAVRHASATKAEVRAVHTWQWHPDYAIYPYGKSDAAQQAEAEEALDAALAEVAADGVVIHRETVKAQPADVLIGLSQQADLVVVGNHGGRPALAGLLGSVSQKVVTRAQCPVVVVHGDDA